MSDLKAVTVKFGTMFRLWSQEDDLESGLKKTAPF